MCDIGVVHEQLAGSVVVVSDGRSDPSPGADPELVRALGAVPAVLVSSDPTPLADLIVDESDLDTVTESVSRAPLAAVALVMLLRGSETRTVEQGLLAESTTYSMLQGGPEFLQWKQSYRIRERVPEIGAAIRVEETVDGVLITLSRPHVHNAFSRRMRDELCEALTLALAAGPACRVVIRGSGPSFCSGGDLAEFGTFPSVAASHVTRLQRSPARLLSQLAARTTVHLHGACMGAGIELPAYARHVTAHPDTTISLPEIALGLVPGAGGTWSLPQRIGRQRTALLALTGRPISAHTALEWGLVDELVDLDT